MKLGVLFTGGKDSCYALYKASEQHEVVCLLTIESENPDSYMFHTPNIHLTKLQAEAMDLSLLTRPTKGEKEKELEDLKTLVVEAKEKYNIEGIVTGAIASVYQSVRVQKICDELGLECINPLWKRGQTELMKEMISAGFEIMISAVAAEGLGKEWLGKIIDKDAFVLLEVLSKKFKFNPAGEGGEFESLVLNAPIFNKKIKVSKGTKKWFGDSGVYKIEKAELVGKRD